MEIIQYPILSQFHEIEHFCTTRQGGCSSGNYASFNLSPFSGDNAENQKSNIKLLASHLQIPTSQIIFPYQTHGDKVKIIDSQFQNQFPAFQTDYLNGVDALITNQSGVCIGVTTADCVPVLLYDAENKVVAAIHAGWRGTCSRIIQKTIDLMTAAFGTIPEKVFASIGVSISPVVYNVGEELVSEFEKTGFPVNQIFISRNNQLYLDLWQANKWLLQSIGVPELQIEIAGICSFINSDHYFSARKLGIKSGRMLSGIMLK